MHHLTKQQHLWLKEILYGGNKEVTAWLQRLPFSIEDRNTLDMIILNEVYQDENQILLNWLRERFISTFGKGSTLDILWPDGSISNHSTI